MLMCCLSCAKADWCEQADRVEDYCVDHEERPMTNADRIRQMSDEELAEFISGKGRTFGEEYEGYMSALDWLKQEVDHEG